MVGDPVSDSEVFTLDLPEGEVVPMDAMSNAWFFLSKLYSVAQSKLMEAAAKKLPPRDEVTKAAAEAYDKYAGMLTEAAKDAFLHSVGALYDGFAGIVKS